jgi:hypothetical protein
MFYSSIGVRMNKWNFVLAEYCAILIRWQQFVQWRIDFINSFRDKIKTMSFLKSAFSFKKTKPRKYVSRSPLKLPADELYRELGPKCEVIDVKVADRKIIFDIENGDWNTGIRISLLVFYL